MTTVNNPNSPNWIGLKGYGCAFMGAVARELAMSEQHTPGPWHWDSDPVKEDHLGRVRFRVCALGRTITQTYYSGLLAGMDQAKADTILIAAAPAMYEALSYLLDNQGDYSTEGIERCRAALKAATGE